MVPVAKVICELMREIGRHHIASVMTECSATRCTYHIF
jgi:hypothetical protein